MTYHNIWSDLINYFIVYTSHFCDHFRINYLWIQSLLKFLNNTVKEQKQQKSAENSQKNKNFKIYEINAAAYYTLIKQLNKENIQLFFLSVCELDEKLKFLSQNAFNILRNTCFKDNFAENSVSDQKINVLFSDEHRDYYDVFN